MAQPHLDSVPRPPPPYSAPQQFLVLSGVVYAPHLLPSGQAQNRLAGCVYVPHLIPLGHLDQTAPEPNRPVTLAPLVLQPNLEHSVRPRLARLSELDASLPLREQEIRGHPLFVPLRAEVGGVYPFNQELPLLYRSATMPTSTLSNSVPAGDEQQGNLVHNISVEAWEMLFKLETSTMSLGDFTSELRDWDISAAVIDHVLQYLVDEGWAEIWRARGTGDCWITAVQDETRAKPEQRAEVDQRAEVEQKADEP